MESKSREPPPDPLEQQPRRSRQDCDYHDKLAAPLVLHALDLAYPAEQFDHVIVRALVILGLAASLRLYAVEFAENHERTHDDVVELFRRIREVERVQAEGRGKLVVIVAILTAAAGLLFEWIGRQFS